MKLPRLGYPVFKRAADLVAAAGLMVVSLPLQAAVAALVLARLGRPILFKQRRPGLNGEEFTLLKFRTMLAEDPAQGLVTDAQRLTPLGRVLRETSLDELPSLWNVLRGDMSMVGPRPLLVEYLSLYTAEQARRHEVRPGLTGLAQVNGRNAVAWEDRFRLDVEYVDNVSLGLDARIVLDTVRAVFVREGITEAGHATMSKFEGVHGH